jgi:hypothetical protein
MSITKDNEIDWLEYMRTHAPDPAKINWGPEARERRRRAAPPRRVIGIDEKLVEQFEQLASSEAEVRTLIHQALEEWLAANGAKQPAEEKSQAAA